MNKTISEFQVMADGGDSFIVIDAGGQARTAWRFAGVGHPLNAICDCGGADDSRSATPPCAHLRAVEVFVFQQNAASLPGAAGEEAAALARELETLHGIRVNAGFGAGVPGSGEVAVTEPGPRDSDATPGRCAHYKLIQRFFAIAREAGMDTSEAARPVMRRAMETMMGRCVSSRSEVSANEWQLLGDSVRAGRLAW